MTKDAAAARGTVAAAVQGFSHTNYLKLSNVRSVLVSDSQGHSEDPFNERPTGQRVEGVSYDHLGKGSVLIMTPAEGTYTITFLPRGGAVTLNLVRGENNEFPDAAARYNDLLLPEGARALLKVTAQGIEPLRLDKDGDGTFETTVNPDAAASGPAASDTNGPTLCFGESRQGTETLVTIAAADSSGVSAIYYSLDAPTPDDMNFELYSGPIQLDPSRTPVVYAFADDKLGNRSGVYDFKVKGRE